jgi:hypothetical protein
MVDLGCTPKRSFGNLPLLIRRRSGVVAGYKRGERTRTRIRIDMGGMEMRMRMRMSTGMRIVEGGGRERISIEVMTKRTRSTGQVRLLGERREKGDTTMMRSMELEMEMESTMNLDPDQTLVLRTVNILDTHTKMKTQIRTIHPLISRVRNSMMGNITLLPIQISTIAPPCLPSIPR